MKVCILGVGTELCAGQIINTNAQWISKKLQSLGIITTAHLVVPDDRKMIIEALKFCSEQADTVFVTGGLGPTSDDFTRDVVSEYCGKPLVFHPESWQMIEQRLSERSIAIKEVQRRQCYFPEGARVLKNNNGTANGFALDSGNVSYYVLPGPPREIQSIWFDELDSEMREKAAMLDPLITRSWDVLGLPESEVANLTENAIPTHLKPKLEIGYRVHMPYVEVKMTFPQSQQPTVGDALNKVETVLGPSTIARNGEDVVMLLVHKLERFTKIIVEDSLSQGYLFKRLASAIHPLLKENKFVWSSQGTMVCGNNECLLSLRPEPIGGGEAYFINGSKKENERIAFHYLSPQMFERNLQYVSEKALVFWLKSVST